MDKKQYAEYLGKLIENIEIDTEGDDLPAQFYGYFQCFMPDGKNVENVFDPLENGQELLKRILPIYEATRNKTLAQLADGVSPGYFCPAPSKNKELLETSGKQHVENLILFSKFLNDAELEEMLTNVTEIAILEEEIALEDDYLNAYLYDTISDWGIENEEETSLTSILTEAYYAINCDYYLSYYLQYPAFENKPDHDFLKSYFEIWKAGYYCKFDKKKLLIYK